MRTFCTAIWSDLQTEHLITSPEWELTQMSAHFICPPLLDTGATEYVWSLSARSSTLTSVALTDKVTCEGVLLSRMFPSWLVTTRISPSSRYCSDWKEGHWANHKYEMCIGWCEVHGKAKVIISIFKTLFHTKKSQFLIIKIFGATFKKYFVTGLG